MTPYMVLVIKNQPANARETKEVVSTLGLRRSLGVGNGNLPQYSCLENFVDRRAWQATEHAATKS